MSALRPVRGPYEPGYPRELTEEEIERLLRPGLLARFSRETLVAGALVAGLALGAASPPAGDGDRPSRQELGKAELEAAQRKALAFAREVLGSYKDKVWNDETNLRLTPVLEPNPPVKYPRIPIMFGNSRVGIFDTKKAVEATRKLFEIYGVQLQADQGVQGEGFEFQADGWDPKRKIGFRLIQPAEQAEGAAPKDPAKALESREMAPLGAAVKAGRLRIFVAQATGFPNMDGDLYTPMEYYLGSVVDYLNWALGGMEIDRQKVLDRIPKK